MPVNVRVDASDFAALSRALTRSGEKELRKQLLVEMGSITKPIVADMRRSVTSLDVSTERKGRYNLARAEYSVRKQESAGKLTERMVDRALARSSLRKAIARSIRSVVKTGGRRDQVGVRVTVEGSRALPEDQRTLPRAMNKGRWRHPVFGSRDRWVEQQASPTGWFERVADAHRPLAAKRVEDALERFRNELAAAIERQKIAA